MDLLDYLETIDREPEIQVPNVLICECGGNILREGSSPFCTSCHKVSHLLSSDTMIQTVDGTVEVDVRSTGATVESGKREES